MKDGDPSWVVDDATVPDDAHLFRRVADRPDYLIVDSFGGPPQVGIGVYSYSHDDGMSVYVSSQMDQEGVTHEELIDWDHVFLCAFPLTVVRRTAEAEPYPAGSAPAGTTTETAGGVILDRADTPADTRIQNSHGLVRIPIRPNTSGWRPMWNAFRVKLMQATHLKIRIADDWIPQSPAQS